MVQKLVLLDEREISSKLDFVQCGSTAPLLDIDGVVFDIDSRPSRNDRVKPDNLFCNVGRYPRDYLCL